MKPSHQLDTEDSGNLKAVGKAVSWGGRKKNKYRWQRGGYVRLSRPREGGAYTRGPFYVEVYASRQKLSKPWDLLAKKALRKSKMQQKKIGEVPVRWGEGKTDTQKNA